MLPTGTVGSSLCTDVISLSETIRGQVCLGAWLEAKAGAGGERRGTLLKEKEKQAEQGRRRGACEAKSEAERGETY